MIRRVHSVASRVLVGLGVVVAALVAIGYAFIFSGIAAPSVHDLGTVAVPDEEGAVPVYLSDGRPAFVVRTADGVTVVDARPPLVAGEPGRLVIWCNGAFADIIGRASYAPDGELIAGSAPTGLIVYPTGRSASGPEIVVGSDGQLAARPDGATSVASACDQDRATRHQPEAGEVFDPSVAIDQEPPGWVWLEGRLRSVDGQALLCDEDGDCATSGVARGIDPAKLETVALDGLFLGRIHDGGIEELHFVPQPEAGR